jgi:hypothetical protein
MLLAWLSSACMHPCVSCVSVYVTEGMPILPWVMLQLIFARTDTGKTGSLYAMAILQL